MASFIRKKLQPFLLQTFTKSPVSMLMQLSHLTSKNLNRSVIISRSKNIYENLALEEWLFKNWNYETKELLMLWTNSPCVVFGRHQNPWSEVDLCYLSSNNILPARRNSGGGTVYHDLGNLNCTFFTSRTNYHRKRNLSFICEVLNEQWGLKASVSERDDILLNGNLKISGTASKLANKNAYHHCTLLIGSEFKNLSHALRAPQVGINSKATSSVPATVTNLTSWNPHITLDAVQLNLSQHFLGREAIQDDVHVVCPNEEEYPGWSESVQMFESWDWIFGKTPKFSATIPTYGKAKLNLFVEHGRVVELKSDLPFDEQCLSALKRILIDSELKLVTFHSLLDNLSNHRMVYDRHFDTSCMIKVMQHLCSANDKGTINK